MKNKFLLSHQTLFMRAPYLFPEKRFFIFTAGYGSGKTSSVATSVCYDLAQLKDKRDREGRRPRIGLGGKSLGHLVKTTLSYIISDLENSKTPYKYNSKDSVLSVGNADLYMVSLARPSDIVGYDVCSFYGDEVDDLGSVSMSSASDMTFEAIKAINERTRQVIPGFRSPFVKLATTSQGQRGLYRVVTQFNKEQTGYVRIKARTRDNFYLKPDYVDSLYRFYTETECIDAEQKILFQRNGELFYAPIIEVEKGDFIFNSAGWQEVEAKIIKGRKKTIKTGTLIATPDHKIYTGTEWVVNETLKTAEFYNEGDIIWNWILEKYRIHVKTVKHEYLNLTDSNGICIQGKTTGCGKPEKGISYYIIIFIKSMLSRKFLPAMLFIIKTEILLTISRVIWSAFRLKNIEPIMQEKTIMLNSCGEQPGKALQGYVIPVEKNIQQEETIQDSADSAKTRKNGKVLKDGNMTLIDILRRKLNARSVIRNLRFQLRTKLSALLNVETRLNGLSRVQSTIKPVYIANRNLKPIQRLVNIVQRNVKQHFSIEEKLVVDLTIKGEPEFIIAGLRCHNCLVYLEGEFLSVGSGRMFPDFDWEQNFARVPMDRMIQPTEELYWSQDFNQGYFRGCVAVMRGNTIYVIKRYEFEQIQDAPRVVRYDFPNNKIVWIPDATSKDVIMTFAAELRKYQIFWAFRSKNPNVEDTVFLVNKLLYQRRLVFSELARESAEACALAMRDPKTGTVPKGIGRRSPIHDIDAVRMLCYFLIFKPEMKDIRDLTIKRRLQEWQDEEEMFGDTYAAKNIIKTGGYHITGPDLL